MIRMVAGPCTPHAAHAGSRFPALGAPYRAHGAQLLQHATLDVRGLVVVRLAQLQKIDSSGYSRDGRAMKSYGSSLLVSLLLVLGCADEEENAPSEADQLGVGAQCSADADCNPPDDTDSGAGTDGDPVLRCLPQFKGGYCGLEACMVDTDCPDASACVAHTDGANYCFRLCVDKGECNYNRDADNESNCSANIVFTDGGAGKACVPPSA